jgi:hypothetical protein
LGFERAVSRALGNKGYEQFLPLYPYGASVVGQN